MFFYLSKIIWMFIQPSSVVAALLALGALLAWRGRPFGRKLLATGLAGLFVLGLSPLGNVLTGVLEDRFPSPDLTKLDRPVAGFIVLGGALNAGISDARGMIALNEGGERIMDSLALSRKYPQAKLIFSGGSGALISGELTEAATARALFLAFGVPPANLIIEDRSRTTFENAVFTHAILSPKSNETWLLVTSAAHMPRAVGCFRRAGFDIVPYPVDFRTSGPGDNWEPFASISDGLARVDMVFKEFVGLVAYYWTGRTDALFPAP